MIDGEQKSDLEQRLINLLIVENTEGLYRCEITVGNWGPVNNQIGFVYFDRQTVDFGKTLKIKHRYIVRGTRDGARSEFPRGAAAGIDRAGRGPVSGSSHEAAYANI
jgi:hypothetical protein